MSVLFFDRRNLFQVHEVYMDEEDLLLETSSIIVSFQLYSFRR